MKPLKTEADYQAALVRMEAIFDAKIGTPESDEADTLALMVDDFEINHHLGNVL
jgi:HTH-type transcriptional regulator/antitoxin HigA